MVKYWLDLQTARSGVALPAWNIIPEAKIILYLNKNNGLGTFGILFSGYIFLYPKKSIPKNISVNFSLQMNQ